MLPERVALVLLASVNKLPSFSWLALSSLALVAVRRAARVISRRVLWRWGSAAEKHLNLNIILYG